jgi:class 3 adenylate cyclase
VSIELLANEGEALAVAWRLQRTGNFVAAFDTAQEGLNRWAGSLPLQHVGILALASCGSTRAALAAYRTSGLGDSDVEDFLALEARLLKDLAFQAGGVGEGSLLVQAAEAYERIVERTRGSYPAQNAAFLWALAGYESRAMRLATTVAHDLARLDVPADPEAAYFYWATVAEAALVLGHKSALSAAVDAANQLCRRNLWARTRTFSQMRRLLPLRSDCRDIILRWHVPAMGFVLPSNEPFSTAHDMELVEGEDAAVLVYEASSGRVTQQELADFGSELHVIMPNAPVDDASPEPINLVLNRQTSGQRAGYTWSSLLLDESRDNEHWCAEVALGLSLGLAEALHAPWRVLREVRGRWCQYRPRDSAAFCREFSRRGADDRRTTRYALFFADAVGYSTLNAPQIRRYWSKLLPQTGALVLRRHADAMIFRKTWGDAVHGVFTSATAAARAALEMTSATTGLDEDFAEGRRLEFRMALHYGAADQGLDPIEDSQSYFGPQLSLAARIVPVVPPGGVFVTEAFAAQLSLEGAHGLACTYVGATQLAKGYGHVRLLALAWR